MKVFLTLVDRFEVYTKAAEQVTTSQAILMNKVQAAVEIDRILTDCITRVCFTIH
jgi:pyruvate decarboxylase